MQSDRHWLNQRSQAIIEFRRRQMALVGSNGDKLSKRTVRWWIGARAAQHNGLWA
jgi:hypothetical protein